MPGPENPCLWEMCCWNGGWVYHHPSGEILFKTDAGGNFGHYTDARADELIDRADQTANRQLTVKLPQADPVRGHADRHTGLGNGASTSNVPTRNTRMGQATQCADIRR